MSDLSQALLDAAAEADWRAHNAAVLKVIGKRGSREDKQQAISRARSRAAVAAVLETLAATLNESARHHDALGTIDHEALRRLAAEAKEDTA